MIPRIRTKVLLSTFALALTPSTLISQSYQPGPFTIDGGGGYASGGEYALQGTIGQPDASAGLSGASFEIRGGYRLTLVPTADAPEMSLKIRAASNEVEISWGLPDNGWVLEHSTSNDGTTTTWTEISPAQYQKDGVRRIVVRPLPKENRLYRLRKD